MKFVFTVTSHKTGTRDAVALILNHPLGAASALWGGGGQDTHNHLAHTRHKQSDARSGDAPPLAAAAETADCTEAEGASVLSSDDSSR